MGTSCYPIHISIDKSASNKEVSVWYDNADGARDEETTKIKDVKVKRIKTEQDAVVES